MGVIKKPFGAYNYEVAEDWHRKIHLVFMGNVIYWSIGQCWIYVYVCVFVCFVSNRRRNTSISYISISIAEIKHFSPSE